MISRAPSSPCFLAVGSSIRKRNSIAGPLSTCAFQLPVRKDGRSWTSFSTPDTLNCSAVLRPIRKDGTIPSSANMLALKCCFGAINSMGFSVNVAVKVNGDVSSPVLRCTWSFTVSPGENPFMDFRNSSWLATDVVPTWEMISPGFSPLDFTSGDSAWDAGDPGTTRLMRQPPFFSSLSARCPR